MAQIYKISNSNFSKYFTFVWIYIVLDIVFVIYASNRWGSQDLILYIMIAAILSLTLILPSLYIFIQYYLLNKNDTLTIDGEKKSYIYNDGIKNVKFGNHDIKNVTHYLHPAFAEQRQGYLPWEDFHYSKIELHDGSILTLTCLLIEKLDLQIDNKKKIVKKIFYPTIMN